MASEGAGRRRAPGFLSLGRASPGSPPLLCAAAVDRGEKQLIKAVGVLAYVSSAWIYCENNTRDRQQRDIRCRSICQHHWGPLTGHSEAPLHALRVAATAVWAPAPSFGAGDRETARRREEAPSRASPVSNQKKTEGRTPTAVKGRPKDARHRANCFRPTKATLQPGSRRRAGLSRDAEVQL